MQIIRKTIRVIDYEKNEIHEIAPPDSFSQYIEQLISHINENKSVREYKTRSVNTEVISCILSILEDKVDEDSYNSKINSIAKRLSTKEAEAQKSIWSLGTNVQKGSLVQALLYDEVEQRRTYLLAKVEHVDFVDDYDFSFKSGFSKDKKTLWKSCLFDVSEEDAKEFQARVYSNNIAKYWWDGFLELEPLKGDELNTITAFKKIEGTLNRMIKRESPRDHMIIKNAVASYFKSNDHIDYELMIKQSIESYKPIELTSEKMKTLIDRVKELPEKYEFDRQFTSVSDSINIQIKKVYDVYPGVQVRIIDAIDDIPNTIQAYREPDGNRYIKIKTDNEDTYRIFEKQL